MVGRDNSLFREERRLTYLALPVDPYIGESTGRKKLNHVPLTKTTYLHAIVVILLYDSLSPGTQVCYLGTMRVCPTTIESSMQADQSQHKFSLLNFLLNHMPKLPSAQFLVEGRNI